VRSRAEDAELGKRRALLNERIWDSVWWRRAIYFATLAATAALATLPWWIRRWDPADKLCSDDRCILPPLIETLGGFLPGFASRWIAVFADKAVLSGVLLALIVGLIMVGKRLERRMHDRSRHFWRAALAGAAWPKPERAPVARWVRTNAFYQRMLGGAKWHVMPTVIAGAAFVAFFYVTLIAINQAYLAYGEPRGTFCNSNIQAPSANGQRVEFLVERPCNWAGTDVTATQAYLVTIDLPEYRDGGVERWRDGGHPTLPDGLTAGEVSMGRIGAPFRRVVSANYLQPLIEIRAHGGEESSLPSVHISALHLRQSEDYASRFLGAFCAARTGRLFVFANDVAGPFGLTSYTYGNNEGRGRIQVTPLGLKLPAGVERPQCEGSTD
jgi:disulfide bond formation protein DsbB